MSPEALSEARRGSNLFASAREPIVMAFGFFISGSRAQEKRSNKDKPRAINNFNLMKIVNDNFTSDSAYSMSFPLVGNLSLFNSVFSLNKGGKVVFAEGFRTSRND